MILGTINTIYPSAIVKPALRPFFGYPAFKPDSLQDNDIVGAVMNSALNRLAGRRLAATYTVEGLQFLSSWRTGKTLFAAIFQSSSDTPDLKFGIGHMQSEFRFLGDQVPFAEMGVDVTTAILANPGDQWEFPGHDPRAQYYFPSASPRKNDDLSALYQFASKFSEPQNNLQVFWSQARLVNVS